MIKWIRKFIPEGDKLMSTDTKKPETDKKDEGTKKGGHGGGCGCGHSH
jgi:hypothetical protein